jgi:hypothetical protein
MRDTIDMARESHLDVYGLGKDHAKFVGTLKAFEALVRADERGSRPHTLGPWQMELSLRREHNGELFESRYRFTQEQVLHGPYHIVEDIAGRLDAEITAAILATGEAK